MSRKTAVIAGASGLMGQHLARHLIATGNWDVIGLARKPPPIRDMRWIRVDLGEVADCTRALDGLHEATHIFYAARYDHPEGVRESAAVNTTMLKNLINILDPVATLTHVHVLHGTKHYGSQLGPVPVPIDEDSPRAPGENFYFEHEDFLRDRSRGKPWSYTISRPHAFCDLTTDYPRSLGLVFAVYASIQRELGEPLWFPGSAIAYETRTQFSDLSLLARAITWMADEPRCANQAFNVVNGDYPRWSEMWHKIAAWFGVNIGAPGKVQLTQLMADKGPVWASMISKYGLRQTRLEQLALWPYGDYILKPEWDVVSSMAKARRFGFHDSVDSGAMFARQFEYYRAERIIP
jgi:nucleoside-diphosphate-sugar epimerase